MCFPISQEARDAFGDFSGKKRNNEDVKIS